MTKELLEKINAAVSAAITAVDESESKEVADEVPARQRFGQFRLPENVHIKFAKWPE